VSESKRTSGQTRAPIALSSVPRLMYGYKLFEAASPARMGREGPRLSECHVPSGPTEAPLVAFEVGSRAVPARTGLRTNSGSPRTEARGRGHRPMARSRVSQSRQEEQAEREPSLVLLVTRQVHQLAATRRAHGARNTSASWECWFSTRLSGKALTPAQQVFPCLDSHHRRSSQPGHRSTSQPDALGRWPRPILRDSLDELQQRSATVLLVDECESGGGAVEGPRTAGSRRPSSSRLL
jgi:hypothetical protein